MVKHETFNFGSPGSIPGGVTQCILSSAEVAPALHAGGPWFDPRRMHKTKCQYRIAAIALDCKSSLFGVRRFESYCWHKNGEVAQLGERESHNLKVTGSTPVLATTKRSVVRLVRSRSAKSRYIGSIPILTSKIYTCVVKWYHKGLQNSCWGFESLHTCGPLGGE